MNKLTKNITFAAAGSALLWVILYYAFNYVFEQIGCDCGSYTYEGTTRTVACGCASQASFDRTFGPLVTILPILAFVIITIILIVKYKRQKP